MTTHELIDQLDAAAAALVAVHAAYLEALPASLDAAREAHAARIDAAKAMRYPAADIAFLQGEAATLDAAMSAERARLQIARDGALLEARQRNAPTLAAATREVVALKRPPGWRKAIPSGDYEAALRRELDQCAMPESVMALHEQAAAAHDDAGDQRAAALEAIGRPYLVALHGGALTAEWDLRVAAARADREARHAAGYVALEAAIDAYRQTLRAVRSVAEAQANARFTGRNLEDCLSDAAPAALIAQS
jgi:hypothetical protein